MEFLEDEGTEPAPKKPTTSQGDDGEDQLTFPDDEFGPPPADIEQAIAGGGDLSDFVVQDVGLVPETPPEGGGVDDPGGIPAEV